MPLSTRDIKRRIKSVKSTAKITKTMEMISAVKMNKAVKLVLASRAYARAAWRLLNNLASKTEPSAHIFFEVKPPKRIAVILVSSNRGLCGSFNQQLAKLVLNFKETLPAGVQMDLITLGEKSRDIILKSSRELKVIFDFPKTDIIFSSLEIKPITNLVINLFLKRESDRVFLIYTDYFSALKQIPRLKQLLPLGEKDEFLGEIKISKIFEKEEKRFDQLTFSEYFFDVSAQDLLEYLLKKLVEVQIYQAVLESNASEHSTRMIMMKNATEAAKDLMSELTLIYNSARQAAITKEVVEISAGRAALES